MGAMLPLWLVRTAEYDWSDWKFFSFAKMMLPPFFLWHHFAASHSSRVFSPPKMAPLRETPLRDDEDDRDAPNRVSGV